MGHASLPKSLAACLALVASAATAEPTPSPWQTGDVFLAVGAGGYDVYDRTGVFRNRLDDQSGGYTGDCGFSPDLARLVTTNYTHSRLVVFDGPETPWVIDTGQASPGGHAGAVVFDRKGNVFVGHPDGNALIHKYSPTGWLIDTYEVQVENRGSNWLDLAADQSMVFYTSQGRRVHRYDTASRRQLPVFAELPGEGHAQALRLLAPGDGSGGLLVADGVDIKRLNHDGEIVMTYDLPDRDGWFAINLDPDGATFWATDHEADHVARFHIATGLPQGGFRAGAGNTVFGVCLRGELTAALPAAAPAAYRLDRNAPNPFNPETQITYEVPEPTTVSLSIYNTLGQRIRVLVDDRLPAGVHTVRWDGTDAHGQEMSSGVYFYRFESAGLTETRRMLLLK